MSRLYRLLAITLILLGLLVVFLTAQNIFRDATYSYSPNAIKCDSRGCRTIQDDGTLADDELVRPEGTR